MSSDSSKCQPLEQDDAEMQSTPSYPIRVEMDQEKVSTVNLLVNCKYLFQTILQLRKVLGHDISASFRMPTSGIIIMWTINEESHDSFAFLISQPCGTCIILCSD